MHWTNPSVRRLAGAADPIDTVTGLARELVRGALDGGWTGPPFDPLSLADHLGMEVRAIDEVPDARVVPSSTASSKYRIEFNPNRPKSRVRFSLAHEIAHTLFPDCSERPRNRVAHAGSGRDEWQLEMLCNIAAAEILMPASSVPSDARAQPGLDRLLALRKEFEVSTEAMLIRAVRLAETPCAVFSASARAEGSYGLDYGIVSPTWGLAPAREWRIPAKTALVDCRAVGFTTKADETWLPTRDALHIEAVGIPPFPGSLRPRVVGLVSPGWATTEGATITFVVGSAWSPRGEGPKVIAHVVNDKTPNWGGGGFAAGLRGKFPSSQIAFRQWASEDPNRLKLGSTHFSIVGDDLEVASMVAQRGYGESAGPRIRYTSLGACLETLAARAKQRGATVHMPRIGCGQAGGRWDFVEALILESLGRAGQKVLVYDLPT